MLFIFFRVFIRLEPFRTGCGDLLSDLDCRLMLLFSLRISASLSYEPLLILLADRFLEERLDCSFLAAISTEGSLR